MPQVNAVAIVEWLLASGPQGQLILTDFETVVSATGATEKLDALAQLLVDLKPIVSSFPGFDAAPLAPAAATLAARAQLGANGQIIGLLLQNLPEIVALISQLLPLFHTAMPPQTAA